jgi:glycerophosphoryl diester phosphodiesterase
MNLQGHRGARGLLPENTLPGFERALDIGVTTLELDCGVTKDGVVVVSHDRRLNRDLTRTPEGRWLAAPGPRLCSLDYAELAPYDVGRIRPGSLYAWRFRRQQPIDGARIPRLADVFALVRDRGDAEVRFNIETKISPLEPNETAPPDEMVRAILELTRQAGMMERVTIQSFDWRTLGIVRTAAPHVPTACLTSERWREDTVHARATSSPWHAGLHVAMFAGSLPRTVQHAGAQIWSPWFGDLTRAALDEAHALGLKVIVWTVNSERAMRRMIAWGVDGIISDYPDLLVRIAQHARARSGDVGHSANA